jgi:hypothetical protein
MLYLAPPAELALLQIQRQAVAACANIIWQQQGGGDEAATLGVYVWWPRVNVLRRYSLLHLQGSATPQFGSGAAAPALVQPPPAAEASGSWTLPYAIACACRLLGSCGGGKYSGSSSILALGLANGFVALFDELQGGWGATLITSPYASRGYHKLQGCLCHHLKGTCNPCNTHLTSLPLPAA